jgi:hypothetical protein
VLLLEIRAEGRTALLGEASPRAPTFFFSATSNTPSAVVLQAEVISSNSEGPIRTGGLAGAESGGGLGISTKTRRRLQNHRRWQDEAHPAADTGHD